MTAESAAGYADLARCADGTVYVVYENRDCTELRLASFGEEALQ